ncbi:IucA/IucC family protein [Brevibacillus borstelensis]|nr:IucA/IucC family protein [Brevibacillus borstelensis]MBE5396918.1 IucA/IucC family siderophore biosynthesis protein [Brevibacillus borstelensis]MCM3560154.1 IucA/IucC family siderophore biosynthesis protein [Brevibacillus borstelensis]MCM3592324.1 IucA/IucC family siderophore biosynthesis protein [Brevibacillus borstelensis]MED1885022.1 IucA/IucC family protein [Brevibacillus borstelensis]NOU57616.1 IucA/IucC family siderophore biosynthesis protein [Brevibacillus borstelensis]
MSKSFDPALPMQDWEAALRSPEYAKVRRRIFRQIVESLIYEELVEEKSLALPDGERGFVLEGRTRTGKPVQYLCRGQRKLSYARVRLTAAPIMRRVDGNETEAVCLATFLEEIGPTAKEEPKQLEGFLKEIRQTLLHDTHAKFLQTKRPPASPAHSYAELEGDILDGHPYHPCYKSRIGFSPADNAAYGPDFKPLFKLFWVAVHKQRAVVSSSAGLDVEEFLRSELGEALYRTFAEQIRSRGYDPKEYALVPVHPWQWERKVADAFFEQIGSGQLLLLGEGTDAYSPQQSIRTLTNRTSPGKAYVKVSLGIQNTSASRILGHHHVENAAIVSDWLESIRKSDPYLRDEHRVVLLQEVLGVHFSDPDLPEAVQREMYGSLGAIWRENVSLYLDSDESAVPFTALCHIGADGIPFINAWVQTYGLPAWLKRVLEASILPLVHFMYAHGIALESHAQNMVLLHRNGMPTRVALRDFPGGIRYYTGELADKASQPHLKAPPAFHSNVISSMATEQASEVTDFLHDAFFHINLSEFAMFLEDQYGFSEHTFWAMAAEIILAYQKQFPQLRELFAKLDLFQENVLVGQLTIRRLCGETLYREHAVPNPLHSALKELMV